MLLRAMDALTDHITEVETAIMNDTTPARLPAD